MANIIDIQTVGDRDVITTDTDPRLDGGIASEIGSIAMAIDGSGIFTKVGSSNTDYASLTNPYGSPKTYFLSSDFDTGAIPTGWSQATSGAGATVDYNQASEDGVIGMARVTAGPATVSARAGVQYSNGINYLRSFLDSLYTQINFRVRFEASFSVNSCAMFGWLPTNASTRGATGNTLCIMYDPANISGYNPGLITNLFLLSRAVYGTPAAITTVDLGIAPDAANWHNFSIIYDNVNANVKVIYDNSLIATLTNLANVPGGSVRGTIPVAAGASLQPTFYVSNGTVAPAPGQNMRLRVDKCSVYKLYNY